MFKVLQDLERVPLVFGVLVSGKKQDGESESVPMQRAQRVYSISSSKGAKLFQRHIFNHNTILFKTKCKKAKVPLAL